MLPPIFTLLSPEATADLIETYLVPVLTQLRAADRSPYAMDFDADFADYLNTRAVEDPTL